jgi:hypothetical protein
MKSLPARLILTALAVWLPSMAQAALPASLIHHVLVISIDGMHAVDLKRYVQSHPHSTLAGLAADGVEYTHAHSVMPADSFPGLLGIMTGGRPAATGVYYDVSYDRRLASSEAACKAGQLGTTVAFNEAVDGALDAHGQRTINVSRLPRRAGSCNPVYPHDYLRTNTVFEVIRAAGGYTAWIDKHPVYEILRGPSGHGINDLYTPEIGGDYEGEHVNPADHITGSIRRTEHYDAMKADALLNEINGWTHDHTRRAPIPTLFGMNMQAVNVAQKLVGYVDATGKPEPGLEQALNHCDSLMGRMVKALRLHHALDTTLIVITAKHGNAPIDRTRLRHIEKSALADAVNAAVPGALAQLTADQGALIWLHRSVDAPRVAAALRKASQRLGIREVLQGATLSRLFPAGAHDSRVPDVVVIPHAGVIYGKPGDAKLAEHGGFDDDDTHVGLLLSNPHLSGQGRQLSMQVSTTQLAPSMLAALGLAPSRLHAVKEEGTPVLPGITWSALAGSSH